MFDKLDELMERVHYEGEAYFSASSFDGFARYDAICNAAEREGFEVELVDYEILGGDETYVIRKPASV